MRRSWIGVALLCWMVFGLSAGALAAPIAPWSTAGQLPTEKTVATIKFALVDTEGYLVSGLLGTAFTLYDIAAGTATPDKFTIAVREHSTQKGVYIMTITPKEAWNSEFYAFKFLVKKGATYGPGMVTLANVGMLWPSEATTTPAEKEQILDAIPLQ